MKCMLERKNCTHSKQNSGLYILPAWQDTDGILHFMMIYNRDEALAGLLFDPK
jgi:hypothetical protein